jgi:hypothetical protein
MNLWPQLLDALEDGPGTAAEIAVELGLDSRLVSVNLRAMWVLKQLTRELLKVTDPSALGGRRTVWVYSRLD